MKTVLLGDVATIKNGKSNSQDAVKSGKYPFFDRSQTVKRSDRYLFDAEAVILPGEGKEFMPRLYKGKFDLHQRVYKIEASPDIDIDYLFYVITVGRDYFARTAVGSTVKSLRKPQIERMPVNLPDMTDQIGIAKILGDLDEKIELNRQMNETLEKIGQALFKHYFIDNPEADDWERRSLDEVADFLNGLAMQKFPAGSGPTLPVIKIRELSGGITPNTDIASAGIPEKYIVHDGDILFSWSGTLIVKPWCDGEGALNQHLFKVTSDKYPKWFYYYWTKYHLQSFIETAAGKATTMGHIQRRHLSDARVLVPSEAKLKDISDQIEPVLEKQITNELETRKLAELRDSLLPRLISGKLKV